MVLRGEAPDSGVLQRQVDALLEVSSTYNIIKIKQKLQELVPEYTPELRRVGDPETHIP
jgi:hypothetical protein